MENTSDPRNKYTVGQAELNEVSKIKVEISSLEKIFIHETFGKVEREQSHYL